MANVAEGRGDAGERAARTRGSGHARRSIAAMAMARLSTGCAAGGRKVIQKSCRNWDSYRLRKNA
jgi:hypothetical protein